MANFVYRGYRVITEPMKKQGMNDKKMVVAEITSEGDNRVHEVKFSSMNQEKTLSDVKSYVDNLINPPKKEEKKEEEKPEKE